MSVTRVLVANRGEIAVRVIRAVREMGLASVAVAPADDAGGLDLSLADAAVVLPGEGVAAYLDAHALVAAAVEERCDALHPGYGFLSESPVLARACAAAGVTFVGPSAEVLDAFGDKVAARALAERAGVPVLAASGVVDDLEAIEFVASAPLATSFMIKAVAGGGGRGMRVVHPDGKLGEALDRCRSEALAAFGSDELFIEQLAVGVHHVEVQLVADRSGTVAVLGERDCSVQRNRAKVVEVAPAWWLAEGLRSRLHEAAVTVARAGSLDGVATVELLVDPEAGAFWFLEANPRLQVEHTVTEEVHGVDLVQAQLRLAAGETLAALGLADPPPARGVAVQVRVNAASAGTVSRWDPPTGPGVRVDSALRPGTVVGARYDGLLAKVIACGATITSALARARGALAEIGIEGVSTQLGVIEGVLAHDDLAGGRVTTTWFEEHEVDLLASAPVRDAAAPTALAGAVIDRTDPLAVLAHGRGPDPAGVRADASSRVVEGGVVAPLQGTVVSVEVGVGDAVAAGQTLVVLEAMKMEHVIVAPRSGVVGSVGVGAGDTVAQGAVLLVVDGSGAGADAHAVEEQVDLGLVRPDLAEVIERHEIGLDARRVDAVAKRHGRGHRTARENIADLCDDGSFVEYGPLAIAAQRARRSLDDLIANTPADGLVGGVGAIDGRSVLAVSYDYMVLAGTQGFLNHRKKDRLFDVAARQRLPVVLFAEGGGGRPGDTDSPGVAGLDCWAFALFGGLSGLVPLVGIANGRCFAGNAALLGCCDVVIATADATIGMGGPAMIEGGGLGVYRPEDVGPTAVHVANGVVDVAVADEAEAVAVAKQYVGYFGGLRTDWTCADQRALRHVVPENRLRVYDVRRAISLLADEGSVLELRRGFGLGMVTALARVEGRPVGIVANDPTHLAGAIDSPAADKAARFLQLCDAFDIPVVFLCDTPGIMVGPEAEATGTVRHASRLFVTGASLTVPFMTIVLRKGYGLGAQAMAGGSFHAPLFTVGWPTAEFGGMGLEGAVKLGFRKELEAIEDPAERRAAFDAMVARAYQHGKGTNMSSHFEIDDVIDPADSRRWIAVTLASAPPPLPRAGKKRPMVDTW